MLSTIVSAGEMVFSPYIHVYSNFDVSLEALKLTKNESDISFRKCTYC